MIIIKDITNHQGIVCGVHAIHTATITDTNTIKVELRSYIAEKDFLKEVKVREYNKDCKRQADEYDQLTLERISLENNTLLTGTPSDEEQEKVGKLRKQIDELAQNMKFPIEEVNTFVDTIEFEMLWDIDKPITIEGLANRVVLEREELTGGAIKEGV